MDNFVEYIIKRKPSAFDIALKILIVAIGSVLAVFFLYLTVYMSGLMLLGACGSIYIMTFLFKNMSVEYEYIITNNEMDIDKIMGQSKRKRLCTLKLSSINGFGPYVPEIIQEVNTTVDAGDGLGVNLWYLYFDHDKHGKSLLLISPNDKILFAINKAVPVRLKINEL
ncbi:MAG: DUF6106 family protein, partial [Eubacterium sp.]|nr:DUF6106 family protein [Eubacterium sp.]